MGYKCPSLHFHSSTIYPSFKAMIVSNILISTILLSPYVAWGYMTQVTRLNIFTQIFLILGSISPFLSVHATVFHSILVTQYLYTEYLCEQILCFSSSQLWSDCSPNVPCSTLTTLLPSVILISGPGPLVDCKHLEGNCHVCFMLPHCRAAWNTVFKTLVVLNMYLTNKGKNVCTHKH